MAKPKDRELMPLCRMTGTKDQKDSVAVTLLSTVHPQLSGTLLSQNLVIWTEFPGTDGYAFTMSLTTFRYPEIRYPEDISKVPKVPDK